MDNTGFYILGKELEDFFKMHHKHKCHGELTVDDIKCLIHVGNMLNDNIINMFIASLKHIIDNQHVEILHTHWFTRWRPSWFRKMNLIDPDQIIVPIHDIRRYHWTLILVDKLKRSFQTYDSINPH